MGRSILLGLIGTFLSMALQVELEGRWTWRDRKVKSDRDAASA
jgi:hypothetical protein